MTSSMLSARLPRVVTAAMPHRLGPNAADTPALAAVSEAIRPCVAQQELAGAVTLVAAPGRVLHLSAAGQADAAASDRAL